MTAFARRRPTQLEAEVAGTSRPYEAPEVTNATPDEAVGDDPADEAVGDDPAADVPLVDVPDELLDVLAVEPEPEAVVVVAVAAVWAATSTTAPAPRTPTPARAAVSSRERRRAPIRPWGAVGMRPSSARGLSATAHPPHNFVRGELARLCDPTTTGPAAGRGRRPWSGRRTWSDRRSRRGGRPGRGGPLDRRPAGVALVHLPFGPAAAADPEQAVGVEQVGEHGEVEHQGDHL